MMLPGRSAMALAAGAPATAVAHVLSASLGLQSLGATRLTARPSAASAAGAVTARHSRQQRLSNRFGMVRAQVVVEPGSGSAAMAWACRVSDRFCGAARRARGAKRQV